MRETPPSKERAPHIVRYSQDFLTSIQLPVDIPLEVVWLGKPAFSAHGVWYNKKDGERRSLPFSGPEFAAVAVGDKVIFQAL